MWEPATDIEQRMRDSLRAGRQEEYFQILARLELLLPVSGDDATSPGSGSWATWSAEDRTHILAFTSHEAMRACLHSHAGAFRSVRFTSLADTWPDPEWWLAVNPGLPIEGYLPAWFVSQVATGDASFPDQPPSAPRATDRTPAMPPARPAPSAHPPASLPTRAPAWSADDQPAEPPRYGQSVGQYESPPPFGDTSGRRPSPGYSDSASHYGGESGYPDAAGYASRATSYDPLPPRDSSPGFGESLPSRAQASGYGDPLPSRDSAPGFGESLPSRDSAPGFGDSLPPRDSSPGFGESLPSRDSSPGFGESLPSRDLSPGFGESLPSRDSSPGFGDSLPSHDSSPGFGESLPSRAQASGYGDPLPPRDSSPGFGDSLPPRDLSPGFGDSLPRDPADGFSDLLPPRDPSPGFGDPMPARDSATGYGDSVPFTDPAPARDEVMPDYGWSNVNDPEPVPSPYGPPPNSYDSAPAFPAPDTSVPAQPSQPGPVAQWPSESEVEDELARAASVGDSGAFLEMLMRSWAYVPIPEGGPQFARPGDADFHWHTDLIEGEYTVTAFTTAVRLAARYGDLRYVKTTFARLAQEWPGVEYSLYVNPGTEVGANMPGPQVTTFVTWARVKGLVAEAMEVERQAKSPTTPGEQTVVPELMQKVIPHHQVTMILERGYDRVAGFVHRYSDVADLATPEQLYNGLGLLREGSQFSATDDAVHVVSWVGHRTELYQIAHGGNDLETAQQRGGWVVEPHPFVGDGFAPNNDGRRIPEYKVDSVRLPHGARIYRLTADGDSAEVASYDADRREWIRSEIPAGTSSWSSASGGSFDQEQQHV